MRRAHRFWTTAIVAALAAFVHAWSLRWSCDDAFISYRYAQHFVDGHGLVFNLDPLEAPVEGYSNFTWTMWLAVGMWCGFTGEAIQSWASFWGALLHALTVLLLAWISWRASRGRALLPIGACALAVFHHAASLAPAGLETALFVLLTTAICWLAIESRRCVRKASWLAVLAVLATMTRPEGGLWGVLAFAVLLVDSGRSGAPQALRRYSVLALSLLLPHLLWRRFYYGEWVPNTYFAKSGEDPYWDQGFIYIYECGKAYALLVMPASIALLALPFRRPGLYAALDAWDGRRPGLIMLAFVGVYLTFVFWVGGDFMFWRFLLPILPLVLLAFDVLLRDRLAQAAWALPTAAFVVMAGLQRFDPPYLDRPFEPISDNRAITLSRVDPDHEVTWAELFAEYGKQLRELFDGLDVRLGIAGSHANLAYRTRVPVAVETAAGLTDAYLAHLPGKVLSRKRAHGLSMDMYQGYLERRGVHFMLDYNYERGDLLDPLRVAALPTVPAPTPCKLVTYDRHLMAELKRRNPAIQFQDFEAFLDGYLASIDSRSKAQVREDFAAMCEFYFDHNDDAERRQRFEQFLAGS
jgi:hypothetical protein